MSCTECYMLYGKHQTHCPCYFPREEIQIVLQPDNTIKRGFTHNIGNSQEPSVKEMEDEWEILLKEETAVRADQVSKILLGAWGDVTSLGEGQAKVLCRQLASLKENIERLQEIAVRR